MRNREKKARQIPALVRVLAALLALWAIFTTGKYAVRFCMGLFMTGDEYIVTLPGHDSPVVSRTEQPVNDVLQNNGLHIITEVSRSTITVTGDLMMHMPIVNSGASGGSYNYDRIFSYIKNYTQQSDYAVANLETTLAGTDNGNEYTGYPKFNSPDAISAGAKTAGFDLLLTANEHCNDTGTYGLKRTLEILKAQGLDTLGTTSTPEEAEYILKDVNGIQVGMMNYTYAEIGDNSDQPTINGLATDTSAAGLISAFDYGKLDAFYAEVEANIAAMKAAGAEIIVAFMHWGDEYTGTVNANQTAMAQKLCDLGVDIIAGNHSHVVQSMDLLTSATDPAHTAICIYSMGNFLSNQRATNISLTTGQSEDSLLLTFTLVKYSDGTVVVESVSALPTWVLIRGSGDDRIYQILPLDTSVNNWQATYEMTDSQAEDAQKSYNRTMEAIGSSLEEIQTYLATEKEARDAEITASQGVG